AAAVARRARGRRGRGGGAPPARRPRPDPGALGRLTSAAFSRPERLVRPGHRRGERQRHRDGQAEERDERSASPAVRSGGWNTHGHAKGSTGAKKRARIGFDDVHTEWAYRQVSPPAPTVSTPWRPGYASTTPDADTQPAEGTPRPADGHE